jgi:hypothetical protein
LVEQELMVGPTARLIEEKKPAELTRQTIAREIEAAFAAEASSGPIRLPATTAGHEISSPMSPTAREKPWGSQRPKRCYGSRPRRKWDQRFESSFLQRGVSCEPDFLDQDAENRQAGT